ncbi:MAG: hypothetical protein IJZ96_09820 [Lachnospiraceae bacterium]|nr:hypothetical protein [Lachnospiraceae bacterium]
MYCEKCSSLLGQNGVCPACGWYKVQSTPNQGYSNNINTYNQSGSQQAGYGGQAMSQNGYGQEQNGYNQASYSQQNIYNQGAYSHQQNGYNQGAYGQQQNGYNQAAYGQQQNGYNQGAYNQQQNGYNQAAYGQQQNIYNQASYGQVSYNQGTDVYGQPFVINTPSAPKKKKWPIIAAISSVLVIVGVVVAVVLTRDNVKDYTNDPTTEQIVITTTEEPTTAATTEATTEEPGTIVAEEGTKTIMMYVVGSDLESEHDCATSDITEVINSGFDEENINYIIYTGGTKDWEDPDISDDHNSIFKVENGDLTLLKQEDKKNMGNSDTLSDFINYAYENYPADMYGLILWNHGGGSFNGYGYDEVTNDCLSLMEIDNALADTPFSGDNKLDFIGFDACLMATIEVADALSPYANYLFASQEPEPGWGWDYSFLSKIETDDTPIEIGTYVVDGFIETTSNNFMSYPFSFTDITLSVLDLSKVADVETALEGMFAVAKDDLTAETYHQYAKLRASTKEIAPAYSGEYSYDFVDMMDMADSMSTIYPNEANALKSAISNMVVYQDANVKREYGVSIYYPYNAKEYSQYYVPMFKTFDFAPNYASYIENFRSYLTNTEVTAATWDPSTMMPTYNGDLTFSLDLTPEQAAEVQNAYFVISHEDPNTPGNYMFVMMSNQVNFDDTTKVTAPFDGQIIYIKNDTTGQLTEMMYTEQERTDDYTRYLISSILYQEDPMEENAMYTYFVLETTPTNPQGEIKGAYPIANLVTGDANEIFPERYEINVNDYANVAFGCLTHEFTGTEDLTYFNEADWADLSLYYNNQPVAEGFSSVMGGMMPDFKYYGMFVFEDTHGERHCSNLVPLE